MVANNDKLLEEENNESESFNILSSESENSKISNNSTKSDSDLNLKRLIYLVLKKNQKEIVKFLLNQVKKNR